MREFTSAAAVLTLVIVSLIIPAVAAASGPVDLTDATPRIVVIELDEDFVDLGAIGSMYGPGVDATFSSDGSTATITVPGSAVEALVDAVFAGSATAVPGSFSQYLLEIDVATAEVLSADITGMITVPILGDITVTQTASSTTLAGFEFIDLFGVLIPEFCTSGAACTLVPGLAYDPLTGMANAVGRITTSSPFVPVMFSPFGDIRLSELPDTGCAVAMTQASYLTGDLLGLSVLDYTGDAAVTVPDSRIRLQLLFGEFLAAELINAGPFALPIGLALNIGPVDLIPVPADLPRGDWSFRCTIENDTTGEVLAEDVALFTLD